MRASPAPTRRVSVRSSVWLRVFLLMRSTIGSVQPTPALSMTSSTSYSNLSDAYPAYTHHHHHQQNADLNLSRDSSTRRDEVGDSGALDDDYEGHVAAAEDGQQHNFVTRVSAMPIVNTAIRAYESSKNSSRVVKVGRGFHVPCSPFRRIPSIVRS
jgi:hypothetical protein